MFWLTSTSLMKPHGKHGFTFVFMFEYMATVGRAASWQRPYRRSSWAPPTGGGAAGDAADFELNPHRNFCLPFLYYTALFCMVVEHSTFLLFILWELSGPSKYFHKTWTGTPILFMLFHLNHNLAWGTKMARVIALTVGLHRCGTGLKSSRLSARCKWPPKWRRHFYVLLYLLFIFSNQFVLS